MLYAYDGLGRMWGDNVGGVPRAYYYAGSQRIEEYNEASQTALNEYFFDGPGSDSIFLRTSAQNYVWYLYDAQGNVSHLCDNNGAVLEMYLYDAYGTPTFYNANGTPRYPDANGNPISGGSSQYDNRYLFKGAGAYQWYASASLYYCRARFYQPYHGRWLQPDPIGQAGGLNIYAYCKNDPVNGSDPSGLEPGDAINFIMHPIDSLRQWITGREPSSVSSTSSAGGAASAAGNGDRVVITASPSTQPKPSSEPPPDEGDLAVARINAGNPFLGTVSLGRPGSGPEVKSAAISAGVGVANLAMAIPLGPEEAASELFEKGAESLLKKEVTAAAEGSIVKQVGLRALIEESGMTTRQAGEYFGWGNQTISKSVSDFTAEGLKNSGWTAEKLSNVAIGYERLAAATPNPSAAMRAQQLRELIGLFGKD